MTEFCDRFENSLMELIYDELPEAEADEQRMHAAACADCRNTLEGLLLTRKLTATLPEHVVGDDLDAPVLNAAVEFAGRTLQSKRPTSQNPKEKTALPAPGIWESLRGLMLQPAFAGGALVVLVSLLTYYIVDNSQTFLDREPGTYMPPVSAGKMDEASKPSTPAIAQDEVSDAEAENGTEKAPMSLRSQAREGKTEPFKAKRQLSQIGAAPSKDRDASQTARSRGKRGQGFTTPARAGDAVPNQTKPSAKSSKKASKSKTSALSDDPFGGAFATPPPAEAPTHLDQISGSGSASTIPGGKKQIRSEEAAESRILRERDRPQVDGAQDDLHTPEDSKSTAGPKTDFERGLEAFSRGDCRSAVTYFDNVIKFSAPPSKKAGALHHIARCEKRRGRFGSAAKWYDRLLVEYPTYPKKPEAMFEAANCRLRLGQSQDARDLLESLLKFPAWRDRASRELKRLSN